MSANITYLLHHALCGALASAGFGLLFNVRFHLLPWCAAVGGIMVAVRTIVLWFGWNMEAATFLAALGGGLVLRVISLPRGVSSGALHVVGGLPLIPGAFAAKALLVLFAVTSDNSSHDMLLAGLDGMLHVVFTLGALGIGLAIPTLLLSIREPAAAVHTRSIPKASGHSSAA